MSLLSASANVVPTTGVLFAIPSPASPTKSSFVKPKSTSIPPPYDAWFIQSTSWPSSHIYTLYLLTVFDVISK